MAFTPKTWANDAAGSTPITAAELTRIEAGIEASFQLDEDQTIAAAGIKRFPAGTLLMVDAGGVSHEPYSDANAPGTLEMTLVAATPALPPATETVLWTTDAKSLNMRAQDGTITTLLAGDGMTHLTLAADQVIGAVSTAGQLFDVTGLSISLAAGATIYVETQLFHTVAASTTGHRYGLVTVGAVHANIWQESISIGAPSSAVLAHQVTTAAAIAAPAMVMQLNAAQAAPQVNAMTRLQGMIHNATAAAVIVKAQAASELANTTLTVKRGTRLSFRAI